MKCHKCNKTVRKAQSTLFFGSDGKYYDYRVESGKEIPINVPAGITVHAVILGIDCKYSILDNKH